MRFHMQSAGISLRGETIRRHISRAADNHRYATYAEPRASKKAMKGDDKFNIRRKNGSLARG